MESKKLDAFDELIAFRAWKEDRDDLSRVASEWQLDEAEIARRALRAGLDVLRKFKMPGVREERKRES
jgi:hypothetical protein